MKKIFKAGKRLNPNDPGYKKNKKTKPEVKDGTEK